MNIDENYTTKCSTINSVIKTRIIYIHRLLLLQYYINIIITTQLLIFLNIFQ